MNCNSSKGKCLNEFTRKKKPILAKTVKNLIFMDFCVVTIYFLYFVKKSCQETLGHVQTDMKFCFLVKKKELALRYMTIY